MSDEDELATARYYDREARTRVAYPADSLRYRILAAGYAGEWDLVDSLEAEERWARVTWRVEANDPLALAACINLSAGNGGIGE